VLNSVGIDLLPDQVNQTDVASLSRQIATSLRQQESSVFARTAGIVVEKHPISVQITRLPSGVSRSTVSQSVGRVIEANHLSLEPSPKSLTLQMGFNIGASNGTRKGVWTMRVLDADGSEVLTRQYTSYLPNETSTRSISALAEAATLSITTDLQRLAGATPVLTATP
jgi:hypothetical protein